MIFALLYIIRPFYGHVTKLMWKLIRTTFVQKQKVHDQLYEGLYTPYLCSWAKQSLSTQALISTMLLRIPTATPPTPCLRSLQRSPHAWCQYTVTHSYGSTTLMRHWAQVPATRYYVSLLLVFWPPAKRWTPFCQMIMLCFLPCLHNPVLILSYDIFLPS